MSRRTALAGLCALLLGAPAQAGLSWCQHDDPAYVERERKARKLGSRNAYKVPCPPDADPQGLPEQLALPMPCGRRMVLRRVELPLEHVLDHREAYLGSVPEDGQDSPGAALLASINGPWEDDVAGAFVRGTGTRLHSYYYLGKYEVTEPQFELWRRGLLEPGKGTDEHCREYDAWMAQQAGRRFRGTRVLPAVNMSWLEAVRFTYDYSAWLVAGDRGRIARGEPPRVPWHESAPGFLRLPEEGEWELAARGGLVDGAHQAQHLYQVQGESGPTMPQLSEIAALRANQEEPPPHSEVFYVGRKQPNLLGLYDTVGNAGEMVYDLFRPTRPDRLAGRRGGYLVKGGNAQSSTRDAGVGQRQERPFFTREGANHSPLTGFRLLLSAPVVVNKRGGTFDRELTGNPGQAEAFRQARQALLSAAGSSESAHHAKAIADLERLREGETKEKAALNRALAAIQSELEKSTALLNERNRRLTREQYEATVLMYTNIRGLFVRMQEAVRSMDRLKGYLDDPARSEKRKERIHRALRQAERAMVRLDKENRGNFDHYVQSVYNLAAKEPDAVAAASDAVNDRFRQRGLDRVYRKARRGVETHMEQTRRAGGTVAQSQLNRWLKEMEE